MNKITLVNANSKMDLFQNYNEYKYDLQSMHYIPQTMAMVLQPIGTCAEYLNAIRFSAFMGQAEKKILKYVTEIADSELKQKVGSVINCNR